EDLVKQNTNNSAELLKKTHQFVAGKIKRMQFLQHIFLFTVSFLLCNHYNKSKKQNKKRNQTRKRQSCVCVCVCSTNVPTKCRSRLASLPPAGNPEHCRPRQRRP